MAPVAIGEFFVGVFAEEARQRVSHACNRSIFGQVGSAASALPLLMVGLLENAVIDVMAPQKARQFG
jgi:hypothetical protein